MVDFSKLNEMCNWEREKAMYLIKIAQGLGMAIEGYGELAVNPTSGYTYLWIEEYPFTLYLPINCELSFNDVMVLWTNPDTGEEIEISLEENSLKDLYKWVESLEDGLNSHINVNGRFFKIK